jgi:hypothetical protein
MKKVIIILALFFISLPVLAQEETLFDGKFENGGFGGPALKVTSIDKTASLMMGGRGAWLINHTIGIGGGGYGLATNINLKTPDGKDLRMEFGYGGLILEYVYNSNSYIHFTAQTLIGGGSAGWRDDDDYYYDNDQRHNTYARDYFFVIEPEVNVEFNIVKWLRIDLGLGYRIISGLDSKLTYSGTTIKSLESKDLSGLSGVLTFKFGLF